MGLNYIPMKGIVEASGMGRHIDRQWYRRNMLMGGPPVMVAPAWCSSKVRSQIGARSSPN